MKWYFFYTPNYHFYKNHIINRISNHFDTKPLEIPQLKLANPDEKGHHFANITLKIELIISCIKENMNENIIFTDATIYINENVDELYKYLQEKTKNNNDMIFARENNLYNIGFILIHCNEKVLQFWENCLDIMKQKMEIGESAHDQLVVINMIKSNEYSYLNINSFEQNRIWVSNELPEEVRNDFYIFKMTVRLDIINYNKEGDPKQYSAHKQRLNALYFARFITFEQHNREALNEYSW